MRTTLDIDDDVLQAAKELGRRERKTAGKILSDLARKALTSTAELTGPGDFVLKNGWYVLPNRGGTVTNEMVERLLEEADLEDAGIIKKE